MKALTNALQQFARDEDGLTAIEYGLLAAVVAGVIGVAFAELGKQVAAAFGDISTTITDALK